MSLIWPTMYHKVLMKATVLIFLTLITLFCLACPPPAGPKILVFGDSLEISVTEVEGGIQIENLSGVACIIFVSSAEGEQEIELAAGESVTVTGLTPPVRVSAVAAAS